MGSSLRPTLIIDVAGQPLPFTQPFVQPFLELEQAPAEYDVTIDALATATLWNGAPPFSTYDFVAIQSDRDVHVEFVVHGGSGDESHFTLFCRGGGFPIVVPGGDSYTGQTGTQSAFTNGTLRSITRINAQNLDTTFPAVVTVFIAQESV